MGKQQRKLETEITLDHNDYDLIEGDADVFTKNWRNTRVMLAVACSYNPTDGNHIDFEVTSRHREEAGDHTTFEGRKTVSEPITLGDGERFVKFKDDLSTFKYERSLKGELQGWQALPLGSGGLVYDARVRFDGKGDDAGIQGAVLRIALTYIVEVPD